MFLESGQGKRILALFMRVGMKKKREMMIRGDLWVLLRKLFFAEIFEILREGEKNKWQGSMLWMVVSFVWRCEAYAGKWYLSVCERDERECVCVDKGG